MTKDTLYFHIKEKIIDSVRSVSQSNYHNFLKELAFMEGIYESFVEKIRYESNDVSSPIWYWNTVGPSQMIDAWFE